MSFIVCSAQVAFILMGSRMLLCFNVCDFSAAAPLHLWSRKNQLSLMKLLEPKHYRLSLRLISLFLSSTDADAVAK